MRRWLIAAMAALIVVALVVSLARKARLPHPRRVRGTPIAVIAHGDPAPGAPRMMIVDALQP